MTIDNLINGNIIDDVRYDFLLIQEWDKIVFSGILKDEIKIKELVPAIANSYTGDLYGLLNNELDIPSTMWYPIMRINGYRSSTEYDGRSWLVIPNPDVMEDIYEKIKNYINEIENNDNEE